MTSLRGDASSREPLLWVQLLGLAAWPLEALGLLLLLAGGDPGPFPLVERLFCWGLGALLPAVLFWRLPPDLWSLLLLQVPLRGRRERQLRLSALQASLGLRLVAAAGTLPLLGLVWWADRQGGIAWSLSPLAATPRLGVLLVCAPLLALMLWQWQQLVQAIWLLTRPTDLLEATAPLTLDQAQGQRLNLGLPLLLLPALTSPAAAAKQPAPRAQPLETAPVPAPTPAPVPALGLAEAAPEAEPSPTPAPLAVAGRAPEAGRAPRTGPSTAIAAPGDRAAAVPLAIDDQQPPEDGQGSDLNQQV